MTTDESGTEEVRSCPSCGTAAVAGASFCTVCGHSFAKPHEQIGGIGSSQTRSAQSEPKHDVQKNRHRRWFWRFGSSFAVLAVAAGVIFGVPQVRHKIFRSSTGNSATVSSSGVVSFSSSTSFDFRQGWIYSYDNTRWSGSPSARAWCSSNELAVIKGTASGTQWMQGCVAGLGHTTPSTTSTSSPPSSTGSPPNVVPGTSLTAFESQLETQLSETPPKGFGVSGITSVQCALPNSWTAGKVFACYAYDVNSNEIGALRVTIETTQPGQEWDANLYWQPNPGYTPPANSGNTGVTGNTGFGVTGSTGQPTTTTAPGLGGGGGA